MASTPITIEAALEQIATQHGLTRVSVAFKGRELGDDYAFEATVDYDGPTRDGIGCSQASGGSIREAMERALRDARTNRTPVEDALPDRVILAGDLGEVSA